ncbi:hypothetical protein Trydic_g3980 [Trypoxylus dichotomus]
MNIVGLARTPIEKAEPKQIWQNISKAKQRNLKQLMSDKNITILDEGSPAALSGYLKMKTEVRSRQIKPCRRFRLAREQREVGNYRQGDFAGLSSAFARDVNAEEDEG